ncbi:MAG: hypothetical protein PVH00_09470 [Gemmatimonadota bacterium]|jgi:hypothetical protein
MNLWWIIGIGMAVLVILAVAGAVHARIERRRRPRVIEAPNSHYTSKLVLDRDAHERWKAIPIERVHEINQVEVRRLLVKIEEYGIDRLTARERTFLERIAELNPPDNGRASGRKRSDNDSVWSDPFGFQPPLGSPPGGR